MAQNEILKTQKKTWEPGRVAIGSKSLILSEMIVEDPINSSRTKYVPAECI